MRKYLEWFTNEFDETISEKTKPENWPYVGYSPSEGFAFTIVPELWVTFTAQQDNSSIGLNKLSTNQTLEYSTDTFTWNTFDTTTNISLNKRDKVYIRGVLSGDNNYYEDYTQFKMTGKIAVSGNCNAIWNYQDLEAPLKACCGCRMFYGCASLITAPELPATILARYCYDNMFYECANLTTAPVLPATTLAPYCYRNMFSDCSSLTTAPELLATTLADECYYGMFGGCTSLTTAPVLPATELAVACYCHMFNGCTSLTAAPELPATMLVSSCYQFMFSGCTGLTTAPELPATTLADNCYNSMFENCTSLTTAPELPATILARYCYRNIFGGCTSLTTAPILPATTLAYYCYYCMFYGCTNLNHITCLATDISASNCTQLWANGVSSTGTFVKHPNTTWTTGINGIPSGWTVEDAEL